LRKLGWDKVISGHKYGTYSDQKYSSASLSVFNHLEYNNCLSQKKSLYHCLKIFYRTQDQDVFDYLPLTFHIKKGALDEELRRFEEMYKAYSETGQEIWIVKPGENTNRGRGVYVSDDIREIRTMVSTTKNEYGGSRTHIIQKYIENPLLIKNRKFDIRIFVLLTAFNGSL
jgi:hypothetical protein